MLTDLEKIITDVYTLLKKKNSMYGDTNIEKHGVQGILIRMDDKLSRIKNLLGKDYKDDETIIDTAMDMIGYLVHLIRLEKKAEKPADKISDIIHKLEGLSSVEKLEFLKRIDEVVLGGKKKIDNDKKRLKHKTELPYKVEPRNKVEPKKEKAKENPKHEEDEGFTVITFPNKISTAEAVQFFAEFYSESKIKFDNENNILYVDDGVLQAGIKGDKIILSLPMDYFADSFFAELIDKYGIIDVESTKSHITIK